jgi:hypothetical protein
LSFQGADSLNLLFSFSNHIYYYITPLAEDASKFKVPLARDFRCPTVVARNETGKSDSLVTLSKITEQSPQ